jgi:hypothetical protein
VSEPTLITLFVAPLNRLGIPYMVTGAVAAALYGEPRLTRDIDLVVVLHLRDAGRFIAAWPEQEFYVPPLDALEEEVRRLSGGHCNVSHHDSALRADVYLAGADPLNGWGLERAATFDVDGEAVVFAPVEYVIVNKLRFFQLGGSERHLRDVAAMLDVSAERADVAAVERWVADLGLRKAWLRARRFKP